MEEDSLSKEIIRHSTLRPTSTGDIGVKQKLESFNHRILATIVPTSLDDSKTQNLRPKAPITITNHQSFVKDNSLTQKHHSLQKSRKPREQNRDISSLLDSLQHFGRTNRGRKLNVENNEDSIHYVNITHQYAMNGEGKADDNDIINNTKINLFHNRNISIDNKSGSTSQVKNTAFTIPELPKGKLLTFQILSTWGDPFYLGLNGLEIFDSTGHIVHFSNPEKQISADPADINTLPEYENDPRTVDNLLDGINHTCDGLCLIYLSICLGISHFVYRLACLAYSIS